MQVGFPTLGGDKPLEKHLARAWIYGEFFFNATFCNKVDFLTKRRLHFVKGLLDVSTSKSPENLKILNIH